MTIVLTILVYFAALYVFSRLMTGRKANNDAFFRGNRKSPWYMVAFGMVGASISGVTFVSVPGMVTRMDMTYLQTCLGFILGYFAVAFLLLPVYYRHNLTTIYSYLGTRLGRQSYKTGAWFFLLSKIIGASVRFFVVCIILHDYVFAPIGIPFWLTVIVMVALIWLYTRNGGIKTLVWTDTFQTTCLFGALILITVNVASSLGMNITEAYHAVSDSGMSRVFVFDDAKSTQYFWKQFLSGIFIVIVMTGLDQDMMQKNLTCKTLSEAQKDMCTYGFAFVPANALFLALGVLLVMLATKTGNALPASGDALLPMFAASGQMGETVVVLFTIGIVAASFSSADSALTALTTSVCVDVMEKQDDERLRRRVHLLLCVLFVVFILSFKMVNSTSVIDAIYIICSYTYGPLLGLFAFALLYPKLKPWDAAVPYIAVASPLLCYAIDTMTQTLWGYKFGYELLMLNGILTVVGLLCSRYIQKAACQTPS
ncbi:MAG: sodium:solute symporter [Prevotella sp.]